MQTVSILEHSSHPSPPNGSARSGDESEQLSIAVALISHRWRSCLYLRRTLRSPYRFVKLLYLSESHLSGRLLMTSSFQSNPLSKVLPQTRDTETTGKHLGLHQVELVRELRGRVIYAIHVADCDR